MLQKELNEPIFVAESSQKSEINIYRFPWFAPTLYGQAAYETKSPALLLTEGLKFRGRPDDFIHGVRLS